MLSMSSPLSASSSSLFDLFVSSLSPSFFLFLCVPHPDIFNQASASVYQNYRSTSQRALWAPCGVQLNRDIVCTCGLKASLTFLYSYDDHNVTLIIVMLIIAHRVNSGYQYRAYRTTRSSAVARRCMSLEILLSHSGSLKIAVKHRCTARVSSY